jgi:type I restriction enzyme S subunit
MSSEITTLFPNRFQNTEIGDIPTNWKVKSVEEVSERVAMGPFGSSIKVETFVEKGIPIISGQHLHGFMLDDSTYNFVSLEHAERLRNANVYRGDVIFTHAGNVGNLAFIPEDSEYNRYIVSQRQFYMRCDLSQVTPEFITFYFQSQEGQQKLLANMSPVGVPSIAQPVTYLKSIKLPIPPKPILDEFMNIVSPLLMQYRSNVRESKMLASLRITLLPKLMKGEVRIKE